jgi:serine protease Do
MTKKNLTFLLTACFIVSLFGGFLGSRFGAPSSENVSSMTNTSQKTYVEESSFTEAIEKVKPSVVSLILTKDLQVARQQVMPFGIGPDDSSDPFQQFFGFPFGNQNFQFRHVQPQQQQKNTQKPETKKQRIGGGSGFIVTEDGLVMTNRHVVDDDTADYTVVLNDGQEFPAKIVARDPLNDLAFVKIQKKGGKNLPKLAPVVFGDSSALKVGQRVLAIGNALAEYQNTVTAGIISANGRRIVAGDGRGGSESLSGLLQTDAAINPGNSGGPLVNLAGQVIGVNVAIAASANGIGFAIPSNDAKGVLESVQKEGKIVRPIIGVRYMMIHEDRAKELQLKGVTDGALLVGNEENGEFAVIPGGPGEKAGLKKGDVIIAVDGKKINEDFTLQDSIRSRRPGDTLRLTVWSSGSVVEKTLKLGQAEDQ